MQHSISVQQKIKEHKYGLSAKSPDLVIAGSNIYILLAIRKNTMQAQTIYVTIFEDNRDLREGMQQILNASPGFSCASAYANCNNILRRLHESEPDVVLMDIQMPVMSGIEAAAVIRQEFP